MFRVLTQRERLADLQKRNKELEAENAKQAAFIDYNVMMGNIEDPSEDEEEQEAE